MNRVFTVYIVINTNRWGDPSVHVLDDKVKALQWGEEMLKKAFKVLDIDEAKYKNKTFAPGDTLSEAPEFKYLVLKDLFLTDEKGENS